jgi:hypothetical protein
MEPFLIEPEHIAQKRYLKLSFKSVLAKTSVSHKPTSIQRVFTAPDAGREMSGSIELNRQGKYSVLLERSPIQALGP